MEFRYFALIRVLPLSAFVSYFFYFINKKGLIANKNVQTTKNIDNDYEDNKKEYDFQEVGKEKGNKDIDDRSFWDVDICIVVPFIFSWVIVVNNTVCSLYR